MKRNLMPATLVLLTVTLLLNSCGKSVNTGSSNPPPTPPTPPVVTPPTAKKWIVSTVAGHGGGVSYSDGDSAQAGFNQPEGLTIDAQGNLFITDLGNEAIRKIVLPGTVTTYLGHGVGNPSPAFFTMFGIAADSGQNLYTVEYGFIRKISPGKNEIFVGSTNYGYADNTGTLAAFKRPYWIALDHQGNLLVPDFDLHDTFRLRKITPAGVVSTMTLQDPNIATSYSHTNIPVAVAVDPGGIIYVTSGEGSLLKKVDAQGNVTIIAGDGKFGFKDGKGTAAEFGFLNAIACDPSGNIWGADYVNNAIRKITPDGTVTTIAGSVYGYADGDSTKALFGQPYDIKVNNDGVVFVLEVGNNRVRKIEFK